MKIIFRTCGIFVGYVGGFRKDFHHETISYNRRKDCEFVELENFDLASTNIF